MFLLITHFFLPFFRSYCCCSRHVAFPIDMMKQALELAKRPHIIIATPGRLADHIRSSAEVIHFDRIRFLVLDEADHLMTSCFAEDLNCILDRLPEAGVRQTLLFSATMRRDLFSIHDLKNYFIDEPFVYHESETHHYSTVDVLDQRYLIIPGRVKELYLYYLINEVWKDCSIIIFVAKCKRCELLRLMFRELKIDTTALHSLMNQHDRLATLARFKTGLVKILIATDIGARGLDIPLVKIVINFDVPLSTKDYVHRVGRTARAGRGGLALTLVSEHDIELIQSIEKKLGKQLVEYEEPPEQQILTHIDLISSARRLARMKMIDREFGKKKVIHHLKEKFRQRSSSSSSYKKSSYL
jgi:ATP-dependent RNA helicase DDX49/DBP8